MEAELIKKLKVWGLALRERDLAVKLQHAAETAGLSAEDTAIELLSFSEKRPLSTSSVDGNKLIALADIEAFSLWLNQPKRKKAKFQPESLDFSSSGWDEPMSDVLADKSNITPTRPPASAKKPKIPIAPLNASTPASSFKSRQQSGQVVQVLNGHLQFDHEIQQAEQQEHRCTVEESGTKHSQSGKHYMMDRLQDKVNYLESRINSFAAAFEAVTGCAPSHPVYAACQDVAHMVGRICCDSEGRLNEHSVMLEGSVELSNGMRTKLDLSKLDSFKLFPGQHTSKVTPLEVACCRAACKESHRSCATAETLDCFLSHLIVVVSGTNPAGACIVAQQLYTSLPKEMPQTRLEQLQQHAIATGARSHFHCRHAWPQLGLDDWEHDLMQSRGRATYCCLFACGCNKGPAGLSIVVAAGPFCSKDSAVYDPLQALLDQCTQQPPDVLVLLGPFVDVNHPQIQAGTLDSTYEDLFRTQVTHRIDSFLANHAQVHVALLPSTQDASHQPVFPQPPFSADSLQSQYPEQISLLPNPATFACNEVRVGVVTADVLRHLSGQEVQKGPPGDRLPGLAAHLVGQQSYYPLYPAASGAMLDSSLASNLQMPCTPDIILLPSDLNAFAKLTSVRSAPILSSDQSAAGQPASSCRHVVCVNPGRLTKGASGGTFVRFQIAPSAEGKAAAADRPPATNGTLSHAVHTRCKANIIKI